MPKFTVTLRRVIVSEVVFDGPDLTAASVRAQINADGPHEWMLDNSANEQYDVVTISKVRRS